VARFRANTVAEPFFADAGQLALYPIQEAVLDFVSKLRPAYRKISRAPDGTDAPAKTYWPIQGRAGSFVARNRSRRKGWKNGPNGGNSGVYWLL